jgi:pyruvate,water dikinase
MKESVKRLPPEQELVFSSASPGPLDPRQVGNKALNLWRLGRAGLRVPPWFVLPSDLFESLIEPFSANMRELVKNGDDHVREVYVEQLLQVGREVLTSLVEKELNCRFRDVSRFSVRSSAVEEDSTRVSFAGIMDSYLFIHREDLIEKIAQCAGSALSKRAMIYRRTIEIPPWPILVAVIVQEMIPSAKSGVLFSRDPVSDRKTIVINAGFGLGEGIVSSRVEADTLWLDAATGQVTRKEIAIKRTKVVEAEPPHKGTKLLPLGEILKPVLDSREISFLFEVMKRIETVFDYLQDVEWAFDESGHLYILQARPITSLAEAPSEITVWDNSNIVESYPGVSSPLTYSFARYVYEQVLKRTAIGLTLNRRAIEEHSSIFETLIGYIDSRIYYNLNNWYSMVSLSPALARDKTACNRMLGIKEKTDVVTHSIFASHFSYATLLWKFLFRGCYRRYFYREFEKLYTEYASVDFDSFSATQLYMTFKKLETHLFRIFPIAMENDLFLLFLFNSITRLLKKAGRLEDAIYLQSHLLRHKGDLESLKPVQSIQKIVQMIRSHPVLLPLFTRGEGDVLTTLREKEEFRPVYEAIQDHMQKYGDRTLHELKFETKSMRDNPAIFIRLIRSHLFQQEMPRPERIDQRAEEVEAQIRFTLGRNWVRWVFFKFLHNSIRESITHRENMRFSRTRAYGLVKRIFGAIGRIFHRQGLVDDPDDVFFLGMNEIFGIINGSAVHLDLKPTVQLRRERFLSHQQAPTPPSRIFTQGIVTLAFRCSPEAAGLPVTEEGSILKGTGCCSGRVSGQARIIRTPDASLDVDGKILVTEMTDPGWVFLMMRARGLIVERGGLLSHTAIIGRELRIPTIVGAGEATKRIPDGAMVFMDGGTGEVRWA